MGEDPQYQAMLATFQQNSQPQQQPQQQQGPQAGNGAKSIFTLADGNTVDDLYVAQLAAQHLGMPIGGVTPDGTGLVLQNGQTLPIAQALQQMGAQVQSFRPLQADYSQAQPMLRAALATLPDDFRRKQYLEHHMQNLGMPQPMVQGAGDDWFVYDPQGQTWMAATNAPGLDKTDAAGGLIDGTRVLGALGGSVAGAGLGPAGVIGGAAAGGAGVNALQKAGFEMFDPEYADLRGQMGEGEVLGDIGKHAAVDAAGAALPLAGGAVLGRMMGAGGQVAAAPISRMMQGAGGMAEAGGQVLHGFGQALDNPIGRDIAAAFIPGASQLQGLGLAAQLPGMAMRGGTRAAGHVADSGIGRAALGEEGAAALGRFAHEAGDTGAGFGRAVGTRWGEATTPSAEELAAVAPDAKLWGGLGIQSEEQLAENLARQNVGRRVGDTGSRIGSLIDAISRMGQGAESMARGISGAGIKGARYGGSMLEAAGGAARRAGALGRNIRGVSLEDQLYGHLGAEEAYSRLSHASIDDDPYERSRRERESYLAGGY